MLIIEGQNYGSEEDPHRHVYFEDIPHPDGSVSGEVDAFIQRLVPGIIGAIYEAQQYDQELQESNARELLHSLVRKRTISYAYRHNFESILNGESHSAYQKMLTQQVINGHLSAAELMTRMKDMDQWPGLDEYASLLVNNNGLCMTVDVAKEAPAFRVASRQIGEDDFAELAPEQTVFSRKSGMTHHALQSEVVSIPWSDDLPPELKINLESKERFKILSPRVHISHGVIEKGQYKPLVTHLDANHPAIGPPTRDVDLSLLTS